MTSRPSLFVLFVVSLTACLVAIMYKQLVAALSLPALAFAFPPHHPQDHGPPHYGGQGYPHKDGCTKTCVVDNSHNDTAGAIEQAFLDCGHEEAPNRGRVVFKNETYNVRSVMNTTGLSNVDVDIYGTLLWDTNLIYWLNHSLPVGYQNQSSAWLFGGENVHWDGHGSGTLDGNGQTWYDFINGTNNYPGRPHAITYTGMKDSSIKGHRFVQSQMWTMTIIHSENVLLEGLYINSTDAKQAVGFEFSSLNVSSSQPRYSH